MSSLPSSLSGFLARHPRIIRVVLSRVRGSSPRDTGAQMLVADDALWGTIGGGQLEFMAIERARAMLSACEVTVAMDVPLGPEIGQCCGGRVEVALSRMSQSDRRAALEGAQRDHDALPHVYVMGAGHVGRALADVLQHMPVRTILVDPRSNELAQCRADVETRLSAIPEAEVTSAPAGSAFVVLTHDHALDFLITSEALARGDAAYVGLIGSASKRVKFTNWCANECDGLGTDNLICPIGASGSRDKRPSVIAAFVAAEVIAVMTCETAAERPIRATPRSTKGRQQDRGVGNSRALSTTRGRPS